MLLLIVSVIGSSSNNFIPQNVYAGKYSNNNDQASSQVINCSGNDENCVNNNPQAQGKDNDIKTQITIPPGSPGSAEDSRQTVVTLHDDAEGHAAGWNPPGFGNMPGRPADFNIKAPFKLEPGLSFEGTFTNPPTISGIFISEPCFILGITDNGESLAIRCGGFDFAPNVVTEESILTYIITNPNP